MPSFLELERVGTWPSYTALVCTVVAVPLTGTREEQLLLIVPDEGEKKISHSSLCSCRNQKTCLVKTQKPRNESAGGKHCRIKRLNIVWVDFPTFPPSKQNHPIPNVLIWCNQYCLYNAHAPSRRRLKMSPQASFFFVFSSIVLIISSPMRWASGRRGPKYVCIFSNFSW